MDAKWNGHEPCWLVDSNQGEGLAESVELVVQPPGFASRQTVRLFELLAKFGELLP